jgi:hypothetical protein
MGHGRNEKLIQSFDRGNLKGRDHLEDIGVGERLILSDVKKTE